MRRLRSISAWLVFFRHQERGSLMKWSPPHPARAKGLAIMKRLAVVLAEHELPVRLTVLLQRLHNHLIYLDEQIKAIDKELACQVADDDLGSRLLSIPCVGPITASLLAVEMGDGRWAMVSSIDAAGALPHQWDWYPSNTAPAARPTYWGSVNAATSTFDSCSCNVPGSTCRDSITRKEPWPTGFVHC